MDWQNIPKCGYFKEIRKPRERTRGVQKFCTLLQDTTKKFAQHNRKAYDLTGGDFPFGYSEKTIQSVIATSLYEAGGLPYAEQPIPRRRSNRDSRPKSGSLDYWVLYENQEFLVELKHATYSPNGNGLPQSLKDRWSTGIRQVNSIDEKFIEDMCLRKGGVYRVVMMLTPILQKWDTADSALKLPKEALGDMCDELSHGLEPEPNWIGAWSLHPELQKAQDWETKKNRWRSYSGVLVFCNIEQAA